MYFGYSRISLREAEVEAAIFLFIPFLLYVSCVPGRLNLNFLIYFIDSILEESY